MDDAAIDELVETVLPLGHHLSAQDLKRELPAYISEAQNVRIDHEDVQAFSDQVLRFWRGASKRNLQVPTRSSIIAHLSPFSLPPIHQQHIHHPYVLQNWRTAARIVFAMSPNSASCERVFSLLDAMYRDSQQAVLADHLQASLMLRYNNRNIMET